MPTLVKARMVTSFKTLSAMMSPSDARQQLGPNSWGVIVDTNSVPLALIQDKDLDSAPVSSAVTLRDILGALPPPVIVGGEVTMQEFANSKDAQSFASGIRGAIVTGDKGIAGVLTAQALDAFRRSGEYQLPDSGLGHSGRSDDSSTGSSPQAPVMRVTCSTCGYINQGFFPDLWNLPDCQNTQGPSHKLTID
jgi:hypothetical protein